MPARPENAALYPPDWPSISLAVRSRAGWRCEECGVENRAWGWRDSSGAFHRVRARPLKDAGYGRPPFELRIGDNVVRIIEIVLTAAHLNHNPADCRQENLRAWCQRCHLIYDAPMKRARRLERERAANAEGDLFPQPEPVLSQ